MEYEFSSKDRERMDSLLRELAAYNDRNNEEILVSCTEAARLLGVTPPTISAMIKDHRLIKKTIGISTGISLREIRQKINSQ